MQSDCDKCFASLYHSSNTTPGNLLIALFHTHTIHTTHTIHKHAHTQHILYYRKTGKVCRQKIFIAGCIDEN